MENEIVVFVNNVRLVNVFNLTVQYRLVPELSSCSISMIDEGGQYIKGDVRGGMLVGEQAILEELVSEALDRNILIDRAVPVFKDNDIVAVFEKRNGTYWWLFHGYVTTVSMGDSPDGRKSISLSCESGLKATRHSYVVMNTFLLPGEFSEADLVGEIKRVMSAYQSIDVSNKPYWEKIKFLFETTGEASAESKFKQGEGNFTIPKADDYFSNAQIWSYMQDRLDACNTKVQTIGDLKAYYKQNNDPKSKKIYIIRIGSAEDVQNLEEVLFASYAFTPPIYRSKLQIFQDIIQKLGLVAHTMPNGDVVVEPLFNGVIGGLCWIESADVISCSYSFSGSDISTCALTNYSPQIIGQVNQQTLSQHRSYRKDVVVVDKDATKAYGLRMSQIDDLKELTRSDEVAKLYGKFLVARSWSNAKSANISAKYRGRGQLNRPVYVQKLDAWFLITSYSISYDASGKMMDTYNLGFGLMWDGYKWGVDVFDAYSQLQLLTDMASVFKKVNEPLKSPKIDILMPRHISDVLRVTAAAEDTSPLRFNPREYFTREVYDEAT